MKFAELLAHPGVIEEFRPGSRFGMLAFHGGSLERVTDQIATAVADRSGASLYTVRQPDDLRWHLPSAEVDPAASAALRAFLDHVEVAVAIHGYGRAGQFTTLLAGGSNRALAGQVAVALRSSLTFDDTTYRVIDVLDDMPAELRGLHPDNPVNLLPQGGVQLELPPRVRGLGPYWDDPSHWPPPPPTTPTAAAGSVPPPHTSACASAGQNGLMRGGTDRASPHTEGLISGLVEVVTRWCETPSS